MVSELKTQKNWQQLLRKAEAGNANAQLEVAFQYGSGIIINGEAISECNEKLEYEWTKRAYENGCAEAAEFYANHLINGIYCAKDEVLAIELYKKAIKAGSLSAAHNLGTVYRDKGKFKKAFTLYCKAHTQTYACINVGMCYYYGIGVLKNRKKAFHFFKELLASDRIINGYETNEANYMIGKMYLEGEAVKRSVVKARHYLLLANEDGDHRSAEEILWIIGLK